MNEPYLQRLLDEYGALGPVTLGPWSSWAWRHDPKHVLFTLSRYKFAAKMLAGRAVVVDAGCGDGIGLPILLQTAKTVVGVEIEPAAKHDWVQFGCDPRDTFYVPLDLTQAFFEGADGICCIDVLEHIPPEKEHAFMSNIAASLVPDGILVLGTPNVTAAKWASWGSNEGHVNLHDADSLRALLERHFTTVLMFSMNDEVVHTGYAAMAHYLMAVAVGVKGSRQMAVQQDKDMAELIRRGNQRVSGTGPFVKEE